jgi:LCP family protein required for cell wall assembly
VSDRPSPAVAAALSFVLPGLGQVSLGAVRRGALLMLPVALLLLGAIAVAGAGSGTILGLALSSEVLVGLLVLNAVLAIYHIVAIVDAKRTAVALAQPAATTHRGTTAVLALLIAATVGLHGIIEVVGVQAYAARGNVFGPPGSGDGWAIPDASFEPEPTAAPTPTPSPSPSPTSARPTPTGTPWPTPMPTPSASPPPGWAKDGRLNLLLIGSDAGPGRWSLRTDTMIVLSVEVGTGRAALFGVPRNLTGVPLADESKSAFFNGRYPRLLNSLYVYAMGHPEHFPGGEARGFRAVTGAIQELVGVRLDGAVVVDLQGFVRLVDAIDGLWVDVPERLVDDAYPVPGGGRKIWIVIKAGCQNLDGADALAYARSRHQDSDYGRMARQQRVLLALADQVDPFALLPKVPELLEIAGDHLWTTIDPDDIAGLAALASRVHAGSTETITFAPPGYPSHLDTASIRRIRAVVRGAFDEPAGDAGGSGGSGGDDCP